MSKKGKAMRKWVLMFLTTIIFTSCFNEKTSTSENSISQIEETEKNSSQVSNDIHMLDDLIQSFIPKMKGVWVKTDYINEIKKTKSPLKSRDKLEDIVTMIIDISNQVDSIDVEASWNNHEVDNFTIYFQIGQNKNHLKTNITDYYEKSNFYEIGYEILNNTTYLFLYQYDKTNRLIGKTQFSKVAEEQLEATDVGWGLNYMVRKKTLSGNYTSFSETNMETKIRFEDDGSLTGFPDFKTYFIVTDYLGWAGIPDLDIIYFQNDKDIAMYAFQIVKDTIYLYTVTGNPEETGEPLKHEKLMHKLVKDEK